MNPTKIIGWILFLTGISLIIFSLYSSYNIFSGKTLPPEIFKVEKKESLTQSKEKIPTTQIEFQKEIEKLISEQLKEVLPIDTLAKLLNLISWSILTTILIFGGSKISDLGIKLIKK